MTLSSAVGISWLRRLGRREATPLSFGEAYAKWAEAYPPEPHNPLMAAEHEAVVSILSRLQATRSLDVGTGTGRLLPYLASTGAALVVGVDLSLPMLTHGSGHAPRLCANAGALPFADASFYLLSASLMAGDIEDLPAWIAEMSRVLRPGGHLVYSDFHPSWAANGWRRTFRGLDGREFELPYFPHTIEAHLDALQKAACHMRVVREPRAEGRRQPVVVVLHAVRGRGC